VALDSLNLLFGAVADLGLGRAAAAAAAAVTLENLRLTRFYVDHRAEIDFYLALAYWDMGERAKELELLRLDSALPGGYGEEAGEVLEKVIRYDGDYDGVIVPITFPAGMKRFLKPDSTDEKDFLPDTAAPGTFVPIDLTTSTV
jgi:hypothetical protein